MAFPEIYDVVKFNILFLIKVCSTCSFFPTPTEVCVVNKRSTGRRWHCVLTPAVYAKIIGPTRRRTPYNTLSLQMTYIRKVRGLNPSLLPVHPALKKYVCHQDLPDFSCIVFSASLPKFQSCIIYSDLVR